MSSVLSDNFAVTNEASDLGPSIPRPLTKHLKHRVRVALSVDFDAISAHLGTGKHPDNNMADYSQGIFAGKVGVPRLVKLFNKLGLSENMTWFIPGHSMETFPAEVKQIVDSGCEIGLHGYSHEGAYQMTKDQESDVLKKCVDLATNLTGKKPIGYRAPLYQIRETTIPLLEKFLWLWENADDEGSDEGVNDFIFPIVLHPDTSGMAHVIGMIERMMLWLKSWGEEVQFCRYEDIAMETKRQQAR
ncbi:MAG: hypothetical protein Q9209_003200 [Squamulea sp. 1 TL-2023]